MGWGVLIAAVTLIGMLALLLGDLFVLVAEDARHTSNVATDVADEPTPPERIELKKAA